MILTEQKIKRIGRRFWRGSKYKAWQKSKSPYNCLYVTGDLFYAITYLKSEEFDFRENGYLIEEECKSIILRMYKSALEKFEITPNILELLKDKLIEYLVNCSFLPFFLMTNVEISEFVQNFNFEKELLKEDVYKKKMIHRPVFNRC